MTDSGLIAGPDGRPRCRWPGTDPDYVSYHDTEWGRPVTDDIRLFEKLCLEGFQAGLSWITVLRKRENFRKSFAGFDPETVAAFTEAEVERLLGDGGIIRHRGKIEAVIGNARRIPAIVKAYGSLAAYVWRFEPKPEDRPKTLNAATVCAMTETPESRALSRDLKKRGWRFLGPTSCYAFMQSAGLVNDHLEGCWCRTRIEEERREHRVRTMARPS